MSNTILKISNLDVGYGNVRVVEDFNVSIDAGAFVSLLGPSGCGKTTVLRSIAGFIPAMGGDIQLHGKSIVTQPPEARDVGIVFQNYALFPTMTAFENIAFGLRARRQRNTEVEHAVRSIAEKAGIAAILDKTPESLSGGQQQRVAIARALVMGSNVLLFDEPLSNLDAKVRITMRREIKSLQREIGFAALFVTHDQEEALSMSDSIVVLNAGKIEQVGTPRELYRNPRTPFIAHFIGSSNELSAEAAVVLTGSDKGRCFVKQEDIFLTDHGPTATVLHSEFLGTHTRIDLNLLGNEISLLHDGQTVPDIGSKVQLRIRPDSTHVFAEEKP